MPRNGGAPCCVWGQYPCLHVRARSNRWQHETPEEGTESDRAQQAAGHAQRERQKLMRKKNARPSGCEKVSATTPLLSRQYNTHTQEPLQPAPFLSFFSFSSHTNCLCGPSLVPFVFALCFFGRG